MSEDLAAKECTPCKGGVPPLEAERVSELLRDVHGWSSVRNHHLEKTFAFEDFKDALDFVNRVGEVAEKERHHPDIHLAWGKVRVEIWTHKIDGLTENDFILAAKIDRIQ